MPKINPYRSPSDFIEGEPVEKESFTGLANNIAGADGAIDENNVRQEGLDGRNFKDSVVVENLSRYQIRTKSPQIVNCPNHYSDDKRFRKVRPAKLFGESMSVNSSLRFTFTPELNTHAIIRCSGVISTRPEYAESGTRVNGFYIPGRYTIDVGLVIRGLGSDGVDDTDDDATFNLAFDRNDPEASWYGASAKVWPYQRVCLNDAYAELAQAGVRKNVTDWRGYKLDDLGKIKPPESATEGALGGIILPEQGHGTEWLYDRKSYMYYNFNLLAHISSEHNSGTSFLVNDSYRTEVPAEPSKEKDFVVDLVYRTNMEVSDLKSDTKRNFEKDLDDRDKYPGVGAVGDYPDRELFHGFGSAKHLDKKLSDRSYFESTRITNLTMNVQIINR